MLNNTGCMWQKKKNSKLYICQGYSGLSINIKFVTIKQLESMKKRLDFPSSARIWIHTWQRQFSSTTNSFIISISVKTLGYFTFFFVSVVKPVLVETLTLSKINLRSIENFKNVLKSFKKLLTVCKDRMFNLQNSIHLPTESIKNDINNLLWLF